MTRLHSIPFSKLGRHIRYNRNDLDAYLEARKTMLAGGADDE